MTEARVTVYRGQFIEQSVVVSEEPGLQTAILDSFNPPVFVEHGVERDDEVVVFRDEKVHYVHEGQTKSYLFEKTDDKKRIEIIHKSRLYKF